MMNAAMMTELAPLMMDGAVRGMAILMVAGVATLVLRRASAATRHLVWTLGLLGVLALPALRGVVPSVELSVLPAARTANPAPAEIGPEPPSVAPVANVAVTGSSRSSVGSAANVAVTGSSGSNVAKVTQVAVPASNVASAANAAVPPSAALTRALLAVWLAGVLVLLLPVAVGWIGLERLARRSPRVAATRVRVLADELADRLGLARAFRLLEGPTGSMPMTFGLVRPAIVMPADANEWPRARLEAVLLHELAHVARWDTATQLMADVVRALHWFDPLAWLAARRLRVEREHACDDMALAAGSRPSEYATELLGLVKSHGLATPTPAAALAMARRSDLGARLRAVLDEGRSRGRVGASRSLAGVAVALLVVTACTAAEAVPADPPPRASGAAPAPETMAAPAAAATPEAPAAMAGIGALAAPGTARPAVAQSRPGRAAWAQAASCIATGDGSWNRMQSTSRNGRRVIRMERRGCDFELRMEGEIEFDAYEMRVVSMAPGARLRIEEDAGSVEHSVDIQTGRDGAPVIDYERDGRARPFDGEAEAWFASALESLFRATGFMATERVTALLRAGGVEAVLRELGQLQTSFVIASYTEALLEQATLDEAALRALVRSSARRIDSDHYLAEVLRAVAGHQPMVGGLLDDYVAATLSLDSDHYRTEALQAAISSGRLDGAQIEQALRAAGEMDSDHYRSEVLTTVADRYALEPTFRPAYLEATATMESDHYRSEVLGRLLERRDLAASEKAEVLRAAAMLDSDHYRTELLRQVAATGLTEPALHRAFFDVAADLDSDHYYRESMTTLLDQEIQPALLGDVLGSAAATIDSDHYLSELLLDVLRRYPVDGATRDAFLAAMERIDSQHYRGRVADALLRADRG